MWRLRSRHNVLWLVALCCLPTPLHARYQKPHIVFIMADDLGWNDVSFHGSNQIPTPNIDALAYNGVILNSHYTQATCTPSRSALMTGKYPIHNGLQGHSIRAAEPRGLPPGKLLPQHLQDLGYTTKGIGKWHLGFYRHGLTPTYRGFDSFFGYWTDYVSYYDYITQETYPEGELNGFALHRNLTPAWDKVGRYATDVFTDEAVRLIETHDTLPGAKPLFLYLAHMAPHAANKGKLLEAPQDAIDRFKYIQDPNRRTYAAMVSKLDESVGRVIEALQSRRMLEDSIVVFLSDNGSPTIGKQPNWGSNYPHRGVKDSLWEGGVKSVALIWSPLVHQSRRVSSQLMHITDWLPTLYAAAGGIVTNLGSDVDGMDQWSALVYNSPSRRQEVLLNIDKKARVAAIRRNSFKLVIGSKGESYDRYVGDSGTSHMNPGYNTSAVVLSRTGRAVLSASRFLYLPIASQAEMSGLRAAATVRCQPNGLPPCNPSETQESCLYNIDSDPCEQNNLILSFPDVAHSLRGSLYQHGNTLVKQNNVAIDFNAANPKKWGNIWTQWAG